MRKPISNQIIFTVDETGTQINKQSRQLGSRGEKGMNMQPMDLRYSHAQNKIHIYIYIYREREREREKYVGGERP